MKGPAVLLQGKGIFEATKEQVPDLTSTSERGDLYIRESLQCSRIDVVCILSKYGTIPINLFFYCSTNT
jgi:hypothetical protein